MKIVSLMMTAQYDICSVDDARVLELSVWPDRGLLIEGLVWRNMKDFSKDAVLLVLASEHYDEADYIRNYEGFSRLKGRGTML